MRVSPQRAYKLHAKRRGKDRDTQAKADILQTMAQVAPRSAMVTSPSGCHGPVVAWQLEDPCSKFLPAGVNWGARARRGRLTPD